MLSLGNMIGTRSQLWRIYHTVTITRPVGKNWPPYQPTMVQTHIPQQKKDDAVETRTSLINTLINTSQYLLIYTDGSWTRNGSNSTWLVAIHGNHQHTEARRNLGKYVGGHFTGLFGILHATAYAM